MKQHEKMAGWGMESYAEEYFKLIFERVEISNFTQILQNGPSVSSSSLVPLSKYKKMKLNLLRALVEWYLLNWFRFVKPLTALRRLNE